MKRSIFITLAVLACGLASAAFAAPAHPDLAAHLQLQVSGGLDNALALAGFGGLIVNAANLRTLNIAFSAAFKGAFDAATSHWTQIATEIPSNTSENEYGWLGASTKFREWVGERVMQNIKSHGYSIKNKTFENTVEVPREAIDDDQYGVYTPMIAQLGQDAKNHPDSLMFPALLGGLATPCYDGQYFFDTDHPVGQQGKEVSVSNYGGGAGNAWFLLDTTKVVKPMIFQRRRDYKFTPLQSPDDPNVFFRNSFVYGVDARVNVGYGLWQTAYCSQQAIDIDVYSAAYAAMVGFKTDAGVPLGIKPNLFLVGPSNWKKALECVQVERLANGADNPMRNTTTVMLCPWLA